MRNKVKPNQYYGYFDYGRDSFSDTPVFRIVCIKPADSKPKDWIGSHNVKFTDMLCLDDYILTHCWFPVDWSKLNER